VKATISEGSNPRAALRKVAKSLVAELSYEQVRGRVMETIGAAAGKALSIAHRPEALLRAHHGTVHRFWGMDDSVRGRAGAQGAHPGRATAPPPAVLAGRSSGLGGRLPPRRLLPFQPPMSRCSVARAQGDGNRIRAVGWAPHGHRGPQPPSHGLPLGACHTFNRLIRAPCACAPPCAALLTPTSVQRALGPLRVLPRHARDAPAPEQPQRRRHARAPHRALPRPLRECARRARRADPRAASGRCCSRRASDPSATAAAGASASGAAAAAPGRAPPRTAAVSARPYLAAAAGAAAPS
jgi:hypothetical protein